MPVGVSTSLLRKAAAAPLVGRAMDWGIGESAASEPDPRGGREDRAD